jgi:hypothetical protein
MIKLISIQGGIAMNENTIQPNVTTNTKATPSASSKSSKEKSRNRTPEIIIMRKSADDICRQSYMISKTVADAWREFNKHVPYKTVTIDNALLRFMDDVKSGKIKFELEI